MIKLGQVYNISVNKRYINQNQNTTKSEEDAVDTPNDAPAKNELNIKGKSEEYRQWTDPKDGGETLAEAIVRAGEPGAGSTISDIVNYLAAYELLHGVKPKSDENDDYIYDPRTAYTETGLNEYGITDVNIIEQYFDKRDESSVAPVKKGVKRPNQYYSLKNDIVINGKAITTIEELVEALGIKNN